MGRVCRVIALFALVACRESVAPQEPPTPPTGHFAEVATPAGEVPEVPVPASEEGASREEARRTLLQKELAAAVAVTVSADPGPMTDREQQILGALTALAAAVEDVYAVQVNPACPIWEKQLQQSGTDEEKALFARYGDPWCRWETDPLCNAIASLPPRRTGSVFWPPDLSDGEFASLANRINGRELLSPLTVVRRDDAGRLQAVPFGDSRELGAPAAELVRRLDGMALLVPTSDLPFVRMGDALRSGAASLPAVGEWRALMEGWYVRFDLADLSVDERRTKPAPGLIAGQRDGALAGRASILWKTAADVARALDMMRSEGIDAAAERPGRNRVEPIRLRLATGTSRQGLPPLISPVAGAEGSGVTLLLVDELEQQVMRERQIGVLMPGMDRTPVEAFVESWLRGFFLSPAADFSRATVKQADGTRIAHAAAIGPADTVLAALHRQLLPLWFLSVESVRQTSSFSLDGACGVELRQILSGAIADDGARRESSAMVLSWMMENGYLLIHDDGAMASWHCDAIVRDVGSFLQSVVNTRAAADRAMTDAFLSRQRAAVRRNERLGALLQKVRAHEALIAQRRSREFLWNENPDLMLFPQ